MCVGGGGGGGGGPGVPVRDWQSHEKAVGTILTFQARDSLTRDLLSIELNLVRHSCWRFSSVAYVILVYGFHNRKCFDFTITRSGHHYCQLLHITMPTCHHHTI